MRKFITTVGIAGASFALIAGTAVSASAADTATTFTLQGGTYSLSVAPSAALDLTTVAPGIDSTTTVQGLLGPASVTDNRGSTTAWVVRTTSSVFTGTGLSTSAGVSYNAGAINTSGTISVESGTATGDITGVEGGTAVVAPTSLSGNNTASWSPTLAVTMPAKALAGNYSGTVTTSLA